MTHRSRDPRRTRPDTRRQARTALAALEPLERRLMLSDSGLPQWVAPGPQLIALEPSQLPKGVTVHLEGNGAVSGIAVNPNNPNDVYVATVAGGIWHTSNISGSPPVWVPLTDHEPLLTTGPIAFSALKPDGTTADPNNPTLYAGVVGVDHGGPFVENGPFNVPGVLRTTDGGRSWTQIGSEFGLSGAIAIAPLPLTFTSPQTGQTGAIVLAAAYGGSQTGLWSSGDGGDHFKNLSTGASGLLPKGNVSDVVDDPADSERVFAAVPGHGVYVSVNAGASWTLEAAGMTGAGGADVLTSATVIRLAIHDDSAREIVYADVADNDQLTAVYQSANLVGSTGPGTTWTSEGAPGSGIGNSITDAGFAADPNDPYAVVVGLYGGGATFHLEATPIPNTGGSQPVWTNIGTGADGLAPHSDARVEVYDGANLLQGDDGGIWNLVGAERSSRHWSYVGGNIQASQDYAVAYDHVNHVVLAAAQDNGDSAQVTPNAQVWDEVSFGDGTATDVGYSGSNVLQYSQVQMFTITLRTLPPNPSQTTFNDVVPPLAGLDPNDKYYSSPNTPFFGNPRLAVNVVDGTKFLLGYDHLYESTNSGTTVKDQNLPNLTFPSQGGTQGIDALAYGAVNDPGAALVALTDQNGKVVLDFRQHDSDAFALVLPANYTGGRINNVFIDPNNANVALFVNNTDVYLNTALLTQGAAGWRAITGTLASAAPAPGQIASVTEVNQSGGPVILVGTQKGVYRALTLAGANTTWARFGANLPYAAVSDLRYDSTDNVLLAGTYGRGAWTIANASAALAGGSPTNLEIDGDRTQAGQTDQVRLMLDAGDPSLLDVVQNGALVPAVYRLADISTVVVKGKGAVEDLIVDESHGTIPVHISFDGGAGSGIMDVEGGHLSQEIDSATGAGSGSLVVDSGLITYTNVSTINDDAPSAALLVIEDNASQSLLVGDGPVLGAGANQVQTAAVSAANGQTTTFLVNFANKTTVEVDGGPSNSTYMIDNSNAAAGLSSLTLGPPSQAPTASTVTYFVNTLSYPTTLNGTNATGSANVLSVDLTPSYDSISVPTADQFYPSETYQVTAHRAGTLTGSQHLIALTFGSFGAITDVTLTKTLTYSDMQDALAQQIVVSDGPTISVANPNAESGGPAVVTKNATQIRTGPSGAIFVPDLNLNVANHANILITPRLSDSAITLNNPNPDAAILTSLQVNLSLGQAAYVQATAVATTLNGVVLGDTVNVGNAGSLQAIQGEVFVRNGLNFSTLNVDASTNPGGASVTINTVDPATGFVTITGLSHAPIAFKPGDVANVTIQGPKGGDTYYVNSTPTNLSNPTTTLNLGNGGNAVFVNATNGPLVVNGGTGGNTYYASTGNVQQIKGAVTFAGPAVTGGATNGLVVDDHADSTGRTAAISDTAITGLAPAPITYGGAHLNATDGGLTLYGGTGENHWTVNNTPATPTTLDSGGGASAKGIVLINQTNATNRLSVFMQSPFQNLVTIVTSISNTYDVYIHGGPGPNTLAVDDFTRQPTMTNIPLGTNAGEVKVSYLIGFHIVNGVGRPTYYDIFLPYVTVQTVTLLPDIDHSFVQSVYHLALGRSGTLAELNGWLPMLRKRGVQAVITGVEHLPEARALRGKIPRVKLKDLADVAAVQAQLRASRRHGQPPARKTVVHKAALHPTARMGELALRLQTRRAHVRAR